MLDRAVLGTLPAPVADALLIADAQDEPLVELLAILDGFRAVLRTFAAVVMAAATHHGAAGQSSPARVRELMLQLRRRGLTEGQWVELCRVASSPSSSSPLVARIAALLAGGSAGARAIDELLGIRRDVSHRTLGAADAHAALAARARGSLVALVGAAADALAAVRLAVPLDGSTRAMLLQGPTPTVGWPRIELADAGTPGRAVILDIGDRPSLSLHPWVQIAAATAGGAPQVFYLDRGGRRGALLHALPSGAEREDPDALDALTGLLADLTAEASSEDAARPYRGLSRFRREDARLFVGREAQVEELANRIQEHALVVLTGPSGVGKSSLLAAGVLPAFEGRWQAGNADAYRGERRLRTAWFRPGADPRRAAKRALAELLGDGGAPEDAGLEALAGALMQGFHADDLAILVVDQAEELFTQGIAAAERDEVAAALALLIGPGHGPVRVVLSVRGDFFHRLAELPRLAARVDRQVALLRTPEQEQLRRMLEEPADHFGHGFQDGLVDRIMTEVSDQPAALALLSFTADLLWERRDRVWKRLTTDAYTAIGGVAGALASHADAVIDDLPAGDAARARDLFCHLITSDDTRAVVSLVELLDGYPVAERNAVRVVLDRLIDARLIATGEDGDGEITVEIAHEALLVHWERLRGWLADDREGRRHHADLRAAVRQWRTRDRARDLLWRGDLLATHRAWEARTGLTLAGDEAAFIAASQADALAVRRRRRLLIGSTTVILAAIAAVALWQWRASERSRAEAEHQRLAAEEARKTADAAAVAATLRQAEAIARTGDLPRATAVLADLAATPGVILPAEGRLLLDHWAAELVPLEQVRAGLEPPYIAEWGGRPYVAVPDGRVLRIDSSSLVDAGLSRAGDHLFIVTEGPDGVTATVLNSRSLTVVNQVRLPRIAVSGLVEPVGAAVLIVHGNRLAHSVGLMDPVAAVMPLKGPGARWLPTTRLSADCRMFEAEGANHRSVAIDLGRALDDGRPVGRDAAEVEWAEEGRNEKGWKHIGTPAGCRVRSLPRVNVQYPARQAESGRWRRVALAGDVPHQLWVVSEELDEALDAAQRNPVDLPAHTAETSAVVNAGTAGPVTVFGRGRYMISSGGGQMQSQYIARTDDPSLDNSSGPSSGEFRIAPAQDLVYVPLNNFPGSADDGRSMAVYAPTGFRDLGPSQTPAADVPGRLVGFTADGLELAALTDTGELWRWRRPREGIWTAPASRRFVGVPRVGHSGGSEPPGAGLAASAPRIETLAIAAGDQLVVLWTDGRLEAFTGPEARWSTSVTIPVNGAKIEISPDERILVLLGGDTAQLLAVGSGAPLSATNALGAMVGADVEGERHARVAADGQLRISFGPWTLVRAGPPGVEPREAARRAGLERAADGTWTTVSPFADALVIDVPPGLRTDLDSAGLWGEQDEADGGTAP